MTEYWVSQGNKWCDFCKIFISNNPSSIRNHDMGQRHKESVAKRLTTMREDKAAKEKEQKAAARALEQIEVKAQRSYQKDVKDVSAVKEARVLQDDQEWEYDKTSGYYYNQSNGCHYDPNSGFYYTDALGKWVTREEALAAASSSSTQKKSVFKNTLSNSVNKSVSENKSPAPGRVISTLLNPTRSVKGAPSSLMVNKRKRQDEKPKALSEEQKAAIKAREAAKKRVQEREAPLLGLYRQ